MDVAVGWCTEFEPKRKVRSLLYASRPPALFLYHFGRLIGGAGRAILDEDLGLRGLSVEASDALRASNIAYLSSHGRMDASCCYQFRLRCGEWSPANTGLGGASVLVLDTCNVTTRQVKAHESAWVSRGRATPAIVLGFVGAATDGYEESMRGRAFVEHLWAGETFVQSWFNAIQDTQGLRRRDQGVAIGFGPTCSEASAVLDTATLTSVPAPTVADFCAWRTQ
ncbi:hypothetical protein ACNQR7_31855 [Mycolicibacterium senegalense]|uniref:hypothetical protein n=1 Tax=Mycolicibacterium senegalense TaxID=1796 RepID=UPI003AAEF88E